MRPRLAASLPFRSHPGIVIDRRHDTYVGRLFRRCQGRRTSWNSVTAKFSTACKSAWPRPDRARTAGGVAISRWVLCFLCTYREASDLLHKKRYRTGVGRTQQKSRALSLEGEIQRAPGLTVDQIVVLRRIQAHTPNGVSLYAGWLLLRVRFAEFPFHALGKIRAGTLWLPLGPMRGYYRRYLRSLFIIASKNSYE